ncbi:MAG: hypothetical protein AAB372_03735 [Patescibacteria group bacterium]
MTKSFALVLAVFILLSFGLHALPIEHAHPHEFGAGVQAALHGENRKFFVFTIFLALYSNILISLFMQCYYGYYAALKNDYNPLETIFRRGIVHRKHCD